MGDMDNVMGDEPVNSVYTEKYASDIWELYKQEKFSDIQAYIKKNVNAFAAFETACKAKKLGADLNRCGFTQTIIKLLSGGFYGYQNIGYPDMRLKLQTSTDSDNDRLAWGDKNSFRFEEGRFKWKMEVCDNGDSVIVINKGNEWGEMYLKLEISTDSDNDSQAYGDKYWYNEGRYKFWVYTGPLPTSEFSDKFILFCRKQGKSNDSMPIKLAGSTDSYGDRIAWGDGSLIGYLSKAAEGRYQWRLV